MAVAGALITKLTPGAYAEAIVAPAGMPGPDTVLPASVAMIEASKTDGARVDERACSSICVSAGDRRGACASLSRSAPADSEGMCHGVYRK